MIRALVAGALLWSAQAAVPLNARAAACNRDNCFRDVFGIQTPGRSASGAAACSAYLQKTVSPCPVSTTTTAVITSTVATTTSTSTISSSTTTTTTTTTTVTASPTTVTVTSTPVQKRWDVEARSVISVCSPITFSAPSTNTPAYAATCTGTRFSSVCSCNGNVPTAVTTLPASTQTITTISTSSVTASTTVITTFTATITTTVTTSTTTTPTVTVTTAAAPPPAQTTTCSSAQANVCYDRGQLCFLKVEDKTPFCADQAYCVGSCSSNAACNARFTGTYYCVYEDPTIEFCGNGPSFCASSQQ